MVVRAYDRSHRMMRSRKQRTFLNQTISDIVKKIGRRQRHQRVSADCERRRRSTSCSSTTRPTGTSCGGWRSASASSSSCDDTQAEFKKPNPDAEAVELTYPDDLHSFRPRITAVQQVEKVNVRGFDLKAKQKVDEDQDAARRRSPRPGSSAARS